MSDKPNQSAIDWKVTSGQQSLPTTTARIRTRYPIYTVTHTDYVTSTIIASNYEPTSTETYESTTFAAEGLWENRIHRFLPIILAFAIIGILTVLGSFVYLAYRFYQANRTSRQRRRRQDAEEALNLEDENNKKSPSSSPVSATLSNIIPWLSVPSPLHPTEQDPDYISHQPRQREPIRYEKSDLNRIMMEDNSNPSTRRPSLAPSWLIKILPNKFNNNNTSRFHPTPRHMSLPILGGRPTIDNLNVPISSTFKPIDKSSLTLVPRSEIWLDPDRRRGVDELDMWERKKSGTTVAAAPEEEEVVQPPPLMWRFPSESAYPDSPESFAERRFSDSRRRSIHIDSRHSSTTTMQEILPPPKKASVSRSKSESTRYDQDNDDDDYDTDNNTTPIASTSISYPNALNYHQEEEDDENDQHFSKFVITVKLPKSKQVEETNGSNDVRLARQALETSRLKNSSSQWLHSSGSKSF